MATQEFCFGAIVLSASFVLAVPAHALDLTWDANGAAAGGGGTGTWDTTSATWLNGATYQAWNNATLDNAIFAGTAGNVSLGTPITVHDMTFNVSGYLFPSVGAPALTFGGVNPTITTNVGMAQLFFPLSGSTGFTKDGAGTLQISGTSVGYTGVTTVNAGTLAVSNTLALGFSTAAGTLVLNSGSTIALSTPPFAHNYTLTGGTVNVQTANTVWSGSPTLTASTTLNFNGTSTTGSLSGNLADTGANLLSVARNDTGRMTLSGNNSYTGATAITRGELQLESAGALSAGSNLVFNGAVGTGGTIVLTNNSGNFTRSLGISAGQVQWVGDGGFKSSGTDRSVNLGGTGATLTWGGGSFVPDGNRLILGTNSNNRLDFQNGIDLTGGMRSIQADGGSINGHARMIGILSGTGGINKIGNGFLELSGTNSYTGGTALGSGTLLVGSDANLGDASGAVTFNGGTLQNTAAFTTGRTVTLNAGGGTFLTSANLVASGPIGGTGRLIKTGASALTLTGTNIYSGGTTIGAGTLEIGNGGASGSGSIVGDVTNNGALIFNRSDALAFGGAISGTGGLTKLGVGTLTLSGTSTYAGATNINAGTLIVNGSLTSAVTVANGSILKGNGTIGGLGLATGSTVAPGNSIGTLTVNGPLTFNAGSVYEVEVNAAGQSDLINVIGAPGTATINGGTVVVLAESGTYGRDTRYTILSTAGGVTGTFQGLTSNFAFLTPSLLYDANTVYLVLVNNGVTFAGVAGTGNQFAVGRTLDALQANATGDLATVVNALKGLSAAQARSAYDQISGVSHGNLLLSDLTMRRIFGRALDDRLMQDQSSIAGRASSAQLGTQFAMASTPAGDFSPLVAAASATEETGGSYEGWNTWVKGLGQFDRTSGDGNAAGYDLTIGGAMLGADRFVVPGLRLGGAFGYAHGDYSGDSASGPGSIDSYQALAYGRYTMGRYFAEAQAGYAFNKYELGRTIRFSTIDRTTSSDADGHDVSAGLRIGANVAAGGFMVVPMAGLRYDRLQREGFSETGANSLDLTVASQSWNVLRSSIGARTSYPMKLDGGMEIEPYASARWDHDFRDAAAPYDAQISGAAFDAHGTSPGRDAAVLGVGLAAVLDQRFALYGAYDAEIRERQTDHSISAGLRVRW